MQFAVLIYEGPDDFALRTDPDRSEAYWASWTAYGKALADGGVMTGGAGLQGPDVATTLRMRSGSREVQDGPFADSKEHLGGFFLVEVPDLDAAMEWAARVPVSESGSVELRPLLPG